jgi:hypothetical protein
MARAIDNGGPQIKQSAPPGGGIVFFGLDAPAHHALPEDEVRAAAICLASRQRARDLTFAPS